MGRSVFVARINKMELEFVWHTKKNICVVRSKLLKNSKT